MDVTIVNLGGALSAEADGHTFMYSMPGPASTAACEICGVTLDLCWVATHTVWHVATWTTRTLPLGVVRYQTKGFGTHGND